MNFYQGIRIANYNDNYTFSNDSPKINVMNLCSYLKHEIQKNSKKSTSKLYKFYYIIIQFLQKTFIQCLLKKIIIKLLDY